MVLDNSYSLLNDLVEKEEDGNELTQEDVKTYCRLAYRNLKPYNFSSGLLKLCVVTLRVNTPVVEPTVAQQKPLHKLLAWVNDQVEAKNVSLALTVKEWNNIRCFKEARQIVVSAYALSPRQGILGDVAEAILNDARGDFDLLTNLLRAAMQRDEAYAKRIVGFLQQLDSFSPEQAFALLRLLGEGKGYEDEFVRLAVKFCLSSSKSIADYIFVHRKLMELDKYALAKSYAYRIVALGQSDHQGLDLSEIKYNLILANVREGDAEQAIANYARFVVDEKNTTPFPYRGELLIAMHRYATHHPLIKHLVTGEVTSEEQQQNPYAAVLIDIKRKEFAGNWNGAFEKYQYADAEFREHEQITACFLSYNRIKVGSYDLDLIKKAVLDPLEKTHDEYYKRLATRTDLIVSLNSNNISDKRYREELKRYFFIGEEGSESDASQTETIKKNASDVTMPIFAELYYPRIMGEISRLLGSDEFNQILNYASFRNNIPAEEYEFWNEYAVVQKRSREFITNKEWNSAVATENCIQSFERMFSKAESLWHYRAVAVAFKNIASEIPKNKYSDYFSKTVSSFHKVLEHTVKSKLLARISEGGVFNSNQVDKIRAVENLSLGNIITTIDSFLR